jgi:GNAT superfamily N-acetyltransferase
LPHLRTQHRGGIGLCVHPDFWSRGVGTRLLETLIKACQQPCERAALPVRGISPWWRSSRSSTNRRKLLRRALFLSATNGKTQHVSLHAFRKNNRCTVVLL